MSDSPEYAGTNFIAGNITPPSVNNTKMGIDVQNTQNNSPSQSPDAHPQPESATAPTADALSTDPAAAVPPSAQDDYAAGTVAGPAPARPAGGQPDSYGGNFGNDVQGISNDPNRTANQQQSPNRGAFGEQGHLGNTHGGYGNQFRNFDTAAERPAAEATEKKYYGQGASRPGEQSNSYRAYSGQDSNPAEQDFGKEGHAIRDTAPAAPASQHRPDDENHYQQHDTRNLVSRGGPDAAYQNDNGAATVGPAYADDYGHTTGAHLPAGTPGNHLPLGPDGHGLGTNPASARGGYDGQQQEAKTAPQGTPAPINAPDAPQGEGYGYGHERSEQAHAGNPNTNDSRNGFGPDGPKEGSTSQGTGSRGGSYDDANPAPAQTPAYNDFTKQEGAKNYGEQARQDNRPAGNDAPDYGPGPHHSTEQEGK